MFRPLEGHAWLASTTVVFCTVIGLTAFHLWHQHGDRIVSNPRYRLKTERLKVTAQPDWIRSDVVQNAITYGQLYNANLLDPELHLPVRQAFGVQPWVKKVLHRTRSIRRVWKWIWSIAGRLPPCSHPMARLPTITTMA